MYDKQNGKWIETSSKQAAHSYVDVFTTIKFHNCKELWKNGRFVVDMKLVINKHANIRIMPGFTMCFFLLSIFDIPRNRFLNFYIWCPSDNLISVCNIICLTENYSNNFSIDNIYQDLTLWLCFLINFLIFF